MVVVGWRVIVEQVSLSRYVVCTSKLPRFLDETMHILSGYRSLLDRQRIRLRLPLSSIPFL